MGTATRLGNAGFVGGGLALTALMIYTLTLDAPGTDVESPGGPPGAVEVAVFFNDPADWRLFRRGIDACIGRGLVRSVESGDAEVVVETSKARRAIRFRWRDESGLGRLRGAVAGLAARPPMAVVGSDNTFWTAALARSMAATFPAPGRGPALLVPWATAVRVAGGTPLLDLYPRRTLRYAPDNCRQAAAVVGSLREAEPGAGPAIIFASAEREDPYSVDLEACFREALGSGVAVVDRPGGADAPGWASSLWAEVRGLPEGRHAWLILPQQDVPARRLLSALATEARPGDRDRLRVLVADAVEPESLAAHAEALALWGSRPGPSTAEGHDAQAPAEIVASIALALDRDDPPADGPSLAAALRAIELRPGAPGAVAGRILAFDAAGERRGLDLAGAPATRPPSSTPSPTEPEPGR